MIRTARTRWWVLLATCLLASSCVLPLGTSRGGAVSVRVTLPQATVASRYALADLGSWSLRGEGPEGSAFTNTYTSSETQAQVTELAPGAWNLWVEATDEAGATILKGTASAELVAGEANEVSIPLLDANSLQVTVNFAVPGHPALSAVNVTDGTSLDIENNVVLFNSMASTSVYLQASTGFDRYEWYIDGVWESTMSGKPEFLLAGSGTSLNGSGVNSILLIVSKEGQEYSEQFWVKDQGMRG